MISRFLIPMETYDGELTALPTRRYLKEELADVNLELIERALATIDIPEPEVPIGPEPEIDPEAPRERRSIALETVEQTDVIETLGEEVKRAKVLRISDDDARFFLENLGANTRGDTQRKFIAFRSYSPLA